MTENRRIRPGSLLLLLLVVCVFILARSMNSSGTVAYSDMCRYFREEKVQSFTITGDVLKAKLQDGTLAACSRCRAAPCSSRILFMPPTG